jgi:lipopolysaccharide transport system ATP-binding protein
MSNTAIKVENLSKIYRLGEIGTGSIGQDVDRWFKTKVLGKEDPFLKIGETNDRTNKGNSDIVYSLRDINFEIRQGDAVGIIGRNGAGKSTLLKILSRVTTPTTGKINIKGRVASLLEVGTGFHPELTGRENIYLNGAILGMRKREIDCKLDEIIDFSGVERYIDTPVKRYSSGMYVRLAFAVAAHLESEILIVDEVLAVGDAEFQKKCLGKMSAVSKGEGRTVLFVSHNMAAVKELCFNSIQLKNGEIIKIGSTYKIIDSYLSSGLSSLQNLNGLVTDERERRGNGQIRFTKIEVEDGLKEQDPTKTVRINFEIQRYREVEDIFFSIWVKNLDGSSVLLSAIPYRLKSSGFNNRNTMRFSIEIDAFTFRTGLFPLYFWLGKIGGLLGDNYAYDVIDSMTYLNFTSSLNQIELGYDSQNPVSPLNLNYKIIYE